MFYVLCCYIAMYSCTNIYMDTLDVRRRRCRRVPAIHTLYSFFAAAAAFLMLLQLASTHLLLS